MNPRHKEPTKGTRKKRITDSVCVQITTNRQLIRILDLITKTGLFGNCRAAAAERLLSEKIRETLKEGVLAKFAKIAEEK